MINLLNRIKSLSFQSAIQNLFDMNRLYHLIILAAFLFVCGNLKAQILHYDFEQCNVGDKVAETLGEPWTTWNQNPGSAEDAVITDEQCQGARALKIDNGNDLVLKLGDKTAGAYTISFDMFVPEDKEGYFNMLHDFAGANSVWVFQMYINSQNQGNLINGMSMSYSNVTFPLNTWNNIIIEYYVDDAMVCIRVNGEISCLGKSFKEDHNLAAINFCPSSSNNDRNGFYIDNISFDELEGPFIHSISTSPDVINAVMGIDVVDNDSYSFELVNEGNTMARVTTWVDYGVGEEGGASDYLHYDSDPYDSFGHYYNNPYIEIGIEYRTDDLLEHNAIGRMIKGMEYFVPATFETGGSGPITFRIYKCIGWGVSAMDLEILAEKVVNTFNYGSWLHVEFDEPIPLNGFGVVAAVGFQQANDGYPISIDAGPAISYYGNLVRLNNNATWSYISIGNNNIRLLCTGQPVVSGWSKIHFIPGVIYYILGMTKTIRYHLTRPA